MTPRIPAEAARRTGLPPTDMEEVVGARAWGPGDQEPRWDPPSLIYLSHV